MAKHRDRSLPAFSTTNKVNSIHRLTKWTTIMIPISQHSICIYYDSGGQRRGLLVFTKQNVQGHVQNSQ